MNSDRWIFFFFFFFFFFKKVQSFFLDLYLVLNFDFIEHIYIITLHVTITITITMITTFTCYIIGCPTDLLTIVGGACLISF